ncbi:hypothetical protein BZA70DRAFT_310153 [Myxozyma melibiosi]|uniref:FAS1 domain-containing protein n=1 Tax=Myxozyma melibiosi TaxID=54550 RepID=A0ABR1F721_9ASCO
MRVRDLIIWACLSALVLFAPAVQASVSVVDLLSSSPDFTLLVRVLQRSGLIPVLNMGRNITFFAPTNEVLSKVPPSVDLPTLLEYLIITDPIVSTEMEDDYRVYFSHLRSPSSSDYPVPIKVKHVQAQPGEPSDGTGKRLVVGSANVVRHDWIADNGVIQVVDSLVEIPDTLCHALSRLANGPGVMQFFAQLFVQHPWICILLAESEDTATVLLPTNAAFTHFSPIELNYLVSTAGHDDRLKLIGEHFMYSPLYRQNDTTGEGNDYPLLSGNMLHAAATEDGKIRFNNEVDTIETDILFQNGVMHTLPSLIVPWTYFAFTPLKYLYGIGAVKFAEELIFHKYRPTLVDAQILQTIFAPIDSDGSDSPSSEKTLGYHFVDYPITELLPGVIPSRLQPSSMNWYHQRIKVTTQGGATYVNGAARVLRDPVVIGNTAIVPIDRPLEMPPKMSLAAGTVVGGSTMMEFMRNLDIFNEPDLRGWTVFFPNDAAWSALGSVTKYFKKKPEMARQLLLSLMITQPLYSVDFTTEITDYETAFGSRIGLKTGKDAKKLSFVSTVTQAEDDVELADTDLLFESGVIHVLGSVPIPEYIEITPRQLLDAEGIYVFVDLLEATELHTDVLADDSQYVILAPVDAALNFEKITTATLNLATQLGLHILRRRNLRSGRFIDGESAFDSLVPGISITVLEAEGQGPDSEDQILSIYNRPANSWRFEPVRILSKGMTSSGAEIYVVDTVMPMSALVVADGRSWWQRHGVLIALGAAAGIIVISMVSLGWFWIIYQGGRNWNHNRSFANNVKSIVQFRNGLSGSNGLGHTLLSSDDSDSDSNDADDEDEEDAASAVGEGTPFLRQASGTLGSRVTGDEETDEEAEEAEHVEMRGGR